MGRTGRDALLGSKTQTQTNKRTKSKRVYEKNAQGVKSSSSSSLALVLDSSMAEACISYHFAVATSSWWRERMSRNEKESKESHAYMQLRMLGSGAL